MELTPEERQRIYEEEKARLEARREPQPPKKSVAPMVILGVVAFFVIILIAGSLAEKTETTSTPSLSSLL
jgi:beta-lactamase regulating signal transducer with metallopeptidase domain